MGKGTDRTATEQLSAHVLGTRFEHLGAETVERAKLRVIDVVGCAIGGVNAPGNAGLIELARKWGGREEASLIIAGGRVPAQHAAMVNSILARSFDYEVMSPFVEGVTTPAHISGTTVATALAMGEAYGLSGRDVITALAVGDDLGSRLEAAAGPGFTLGFDSVGTTNVLAAAAIAGRRGHASRRSVIPAP